MRFGGDIIDEREIIGFGQLWEKVDSSGHHTQWFDILLRSGGRLPNFVGDVWQGSYNDDEKLNRAEYERRIELIDSLVRQRSI